MNMDQTQQARSRRESSLGFLRDLNQSSPSSTSTPGHYLRNTNRHNKSIRADTGSDDHHHMAKNQDVTTKTSTDTNENNSDGNIQALRSLFRDYEYMLSQNEDTKRLYDSYVQLRLELRMSTNKSNDYSDREGWYHRTCHQKLEVFLTLLIIVEIFAGSLCMDRVAHMFYSEIGRHQLLNGPSSLGSGSVGNDFVATLLKRPMLQTGKLFSHWKKNQSNYLFDRLYKIIPNVLLSERADESQKLTYSIICDSLMPERYSEMDSIKQSLTNSSQEVYRQGETMLFLQILYIKYLDASDTLAYRDVKRVFYCVKKMRGEELLFGKRMSKWIDLFVKRKIRFMEQSLVEVHLNQLFESHRLKIVHHDFSNNNLDKKEMDAQLLLSMSIICRRFTQSDGKLDIDEKQLQFLCANKTTFRSLIIPTINNIENVQNGKEKRLLLNEFSSIIVRIYHHLVFDKNILDNTSLLSNTILCQRLLLSLLHHWRSLSNVECESKNYTKFANHALALNFTEWIPSMFETCKRILFKYGSQFVLVSKSLKILGKTYELTIKLQHMLNNRIKSSPSISFAQIERETLLIFQNYLSNQLPWVLLFYASRNLFPYKQYKEVLNGIITLVTTTKHFGYNSDTPLEVYIESQVFDDLVTKVLTVPQFIDESAVRIRSGRSSAGLQGLQQSVSLHVADFSTDWKVKHAKLMFLFSARIAKFNQSCWLPQIITIVSREAQKTQKRPQHMYVLLSAIASLVSEKLLSYNSDNRDERDIFKVLEVITKNPHYNSPEILTLLIQISPHLSDDEERFVIQDKVLFLQKLWSTCLVPLFKQPLLNISGNIQNIQLMKKSEFYSMRFLFINGMGRMARRDRNLIAQVLNDVEKFVKEIAKEHSSFSHAKDDEKNQTVLDFISDISSSVTVLIWRLVEPMEPDGSQVTDAQCVQCLKVMSFIEMFRADSMAYREALKCIINHCSNTEILIPTSKMSQQLLSVSGNLTVKHFRLLFYVRLATTLLKRQHDESPKESKTFISKKVIVQRIIPLMFSCMELYPDIIIREHSSTKISTASSTWSMIIQQCYQLFLQFFVASPNEEGMSLKVDTQGHVESVRNTLIPHYLKIIEDKLFNVPPTSLPSMYKKKVEVLRKKFCEQSLVMIPKIAPRLNHAMVEHLSMRLEDFMVRKIDSLASEVTTTNSDSLTRINEELNMIFYVCSQSTMVVSLDDMNQVMLPTIARIFAKFHLSHDSGSHNSSLLQAKQSCLNMFYQIISKCMDYTRKQACIHFYLSLVENL